MAGPLPKIVASAIYCIHILYYLETCDKHIQKKGCRGILNHVHVIKLLLMKEGLSKNKEISQQDSAQNSIKHLAEESKLEFMESIDALSIYSRSFRGRPTALPASLVFLFSFQ